MSYRILGQLTVALLVIVTSPYWFKQLNKHFFHIKGKVLGKTLKTLRLLHRPAGVGILAIAAIHGYMVLRSVRLHTGSIAWVMFAVTAIFGVLFALKKKPVLFKWHKRVALASVVLVLVHLIFPNAIYLIFR